MDQFVLTLLLVHVQLELFLMEPSVFQLKRLNVQVDQLCKMDNVSVNLNLSAVKEHGMDKLVFQAVKEAVLLDINGTEQLVLPYLALSVKQVILCKEMFV